ncbi:methyltransferase domain-containing protein [Actinoplanes oblitus]|uniref:Methyltransferase domain-containing protein n=1 Tax=Actinoplanes oblitus TaxID=3040509 RepID=A0ABY8WHX9_9ACTN|nr:methyltransferase domain-containing protein [Actinoplanes oblitus]WIM97022.1 methyltransferase domain-containing protein [Actinoplanes oblitus]
MSPLSGTPSATPGQPNASTAPAQPIAPATPAEPNSPATPAQPNAPATPAEPNSPATPAECSVAGPDTPTDAARLGPPSGPDGIGTTATHPAHAQGHWARYNAGHGDRDIRETLRRALDLAGPGRDRTAVDLGCGAGRETRALLEAGWRVHAYDSEPTMLSATDRTHPALTAHLLAFEQITELPPADLIYAGYALPYQPRHSFDRLWTLIRAALRPAGLIAVDLFGVHDAWAGSPNMTFLTAAEAAALATGLTTEHWHEEDEVGPAFSGPKHWHVFELIARRR